MWKIRSFLRLYLHVSVDLLHRLRLMVTEETHGGDGTGSPVRPITADTDAFNPSETGSFKNNLLPEILTHHLPCQPARGRPRSAPPPSSSPAPGTGGGDSEEKTLPPLYMKLLRTNRNKHLLVANVIISNDSDPCNLILVCLFHLHSCCLVPNKLKVLNVGTKRRRCDADYDFRYFEG